MNRRLYLIGALLLLAFVGFSLTSFTRHADPLRLLPRSARRQPRRAGGGRPARRGAPPTSGRRGAALHPADPKTQRPGAGALQGPAPGQLRGRHQHRRHRPLRPRGPRSSRPTSCWSSAPASTRAPRSRRPTADAASAAARHRDRTPGRTYLGLPDDSICPGPLALWCALVFALACRRGATRWCCAATPTALVFARRAYSFFALSIVLAALRAAPAAADARLPHRVRLPVLRASTCPALPVRRLLGRPEGELHDLARLGHAARPAGCSAPPAAAEPAVMGDLPADPARAALHPGAREPLRHAAPDARSTARA